MKVTFILKAIILLLSTAYLLFLSACSGPLRIEITEENPPTFVLHGGGSGYLYVLSVKECNSNVEGDYVWLIGPAHGSFPLSHFSPTKIKYGELPLGWEQDRPADSSKPPPLIEGKLYLIGCTMADIDSSAAVFTIRNGKAVQRK